MRLNPNHRRAMTLTEMVVAIGIMALIFGAMAYLVYTTGRNSLVVRDQALSQQQAALASQRIVNTLRGARQFYPYTGDSMSKTQSRVMFDIPNATAGGGNQVGIVAFQASGSNKSNGVIKVFLNKDNYKGDETLETTTADYEYQGIEDFDVIFHSDSWITLVLGYSYTGFSMSQVDSDGDGIADDRLVGEFQTDVIAKNHHPGESAHYAETTTTLFQL